ncbi:chemotaxis protein CheA [Alkalimonas collagenimarina]|uniref:histidine kinase n=1 Tax=Alkalimonas collagenimarina TaxID=400390 RepID=A0ABT9H2N3_9GAMM|nr:chemotaxis protein CheA [Alkalimonas collagenimarina]MDP4537557.1 chemotaxis protein CheA [Alkalimonas collagenimarina]
MSFDMDEDILQDFLVEAGEILELLQEQLVELENNPDDANLLNAIFRGFHTVKGGAGFLSLTELVDACHGAENVFDILRTGKRKVTPELMDVILQALDAVNAMFVEVQARQPLTPADPALLDALHHLSEPDDGTAAPAATAEPVAATQTAAPSASDSSDSIDEIDEDEFERLLDELHGGKAPGKSETAAAPLVDPAAQGDMTDDEFEAILDQLHGKGSFVADSPAAEPAKPAAPKPAAQSSAAKAAADEISDDEFESLLDELHGKGKSPQAEAPAKSQPAERKPAPKMPDADTAPAPANTSKPAASAPPPPPPAAPPPETTVRVDTKRLDEIMNMVGELVLVRNRLVSLSTTTKDEVMGKAIANLDVVTADIQGAVMKTRMQPIKKVFGRFPRVVRDLARSLKKDITLELEGEETDLDKNLVEALADPLVHLVRNSVDHGIEMPEVRQAAGKDRTGRVRLAAEQAGDHILLTIEDDGAGMDPEKLKGIAIKRGILDSDAAARMSDTEAFNLIFAPGFSTKEKISDISGRGVGMDVVKTKISQLNGSVHISSELGKGTLLEIKVPLTLAILPTLMVVVGKQTFALPLGTIDEIVHLDLAKTNNVDGQLTIIVRDKAIPLFYLEHWLVKGSKKSVCRDQGHVVILQLGTQKIGFVVDSLIGQEEVVIKPLDLLLQGTPGMAGATITSDGGIALILDVPSLLKHYARKSKIKLERFSKSPA